ncbi:coproporphyrinogen III oxidase [Anaerococcus octavius]|uniref:Coproporphyrinogen III oxidase n=1 Tax=Anaerococcus octavius TaxID=54007 RepID=A0A380WW19_9FIRM|nr:TIGR01212 family radical SAM protein [Anaerococcus octavius]SUU93013.1 coproporphyrinogen III oxidase [Anaerococcus octavius]
MELNKKRYRDLDTYYKLKYNKKIIKLPLDGGFTCPNRDGSLSFCGCIYCSDDGAGEWTHKSAGDIKKQIALQKDLLSKKGRKEGYIAYFQNFTNTYGDIESMREMFYTAINQPDIVGLSIATRADCLPNDVLDLLKELNQETDLTVELGMQTVNANTLEFINRGYDHKVFDQGVDKLHKLGIKTIAHIIIGLPNENEKDYLNNIDYINKKNIWGIKIHNLYIENNTYLKYYYEKNNIDYKMSKDDYAKIVVGMLRKLNPNVVINRLTGDGINQNIAYPEWSKNKGAVLSTIDKIMKDNNYQQGDLY